MPESTVTVKVTNTYACGRETSTEHDVPAPPAAVLVDAPEDHAVLFDEDVLGDWFETHVHPHTADGHSCGSSEHGFYEATITVADGDRPELVGQTCSWEG